MSVSESPLAGRFQRPAIVHEWLTIPGGSEKCVLEMLELLPDAEIYTSVYDPAPWPEAITGRTVHTSFLQRIPKATEQYPKLLPLMNRAFESFDLGGHDLVLSSSHSCAKNVITAPGTLHVCYCHTPMRHAWEPGFLAREQLGRAARLASTLFMPRIRRADHVGSARPDHYIANSGHVADRIRKYYRRDARVIHPPVDVAPMLGLPREEGDYYLVLGRVIPYKRADLAVAACRLLGRRVKVAGTGRALESVRALAGRDAEFLGHVPDAELPGLLAGARALLFPGEEDFGIVPVEAQAAGVPVIAYGVGGVRDSVLDGTTGVFFAQQTPESLADAIVRFEGMDFDEDTIRDNARRFSPERYREELASHIATLEPVGRPPAGARTADLAGAEAAG